MYYEQILKVLNFAAIKHRNQRRRDKEATPYINHPIAVANLLSNVGVTDPIVIVGALLHLKYAGCLVAPKYEHQAS